MEEVVIAVLTHIYTPVRVKVTGKLAHDEVLQEAVQVESATIALLHIGVVARVEAALHLIEVALDVVILCGHDVVLVGTLYGDGVASVAGKPRL